MQAPAPLDKLLSRHLGLARVNQQARAQKLNDGELDRLVEWAPAQARALLETVGHFKADAQAELLPDQPPRVQVRVAPGPRVVIGSVNLEVQGPAQANAARGVLQTQVARSALSEDWPSARQKLWYWRYVTSVKRTITDAGY